MGFKFNTATPEVAKVTKAKRSNAFAASHPINNKTANDKLVKHIKDRMNFAKPIHDVLVERYEKIDKTISGFVKLTGTEREAADRSADGDPTPSKSNIQLIQAQLDEENTFLMSVFSPDSSLYEALARQDQQKAANGFVLLMNTNAKRMQYYRHYTRGICDMLKYNLGGFEVSWKQLKGIKPNFTPDGRAETADHGVVWEGNEVRALDMYNTYWDPSQHPVDIPLKGEFVAEVSMHTRFSVVRMQENEEIYNAHDCIENYMNTITYYRPAPEVQPPLSSFPSNDGAANSIDWTSLLSEGLQSSGSERGLEMVKFIGWIKPSDFNLGKDKEYQIWRITVLSMHKVVAAEHLNNLHAMLPFLFGSPLEDGLGLQQKSYAEILTPMQEFGSFLLNAHKKAVRKAMYGIQVYDPSFIPLDDVGDETAARIPCKPAGYGQDLKKAISSFNDAPATDKTMTDFTRVIEIMQHLLPTDNLKQVAGLERATQYHAAATVQGGNRRSLKIARILNDQVFTGVRQVQFYNILQFQPTLDIIGPDGKPVEITPSAFAELDFEFIVDEGLKSLDKLTVISQTGDLVNAILQSPVASQEIDLVKLLNWRTSMMGDQTDLTQFRRQQPTQVGPDGKPQLEAAEPTGGSNV